MYEHIKATTLNRRTILNAQKNEILKESEKNKGRRVVASSRACADWWQLWQIQRIISNLEVWNTKQEKAELKINRDITKVIIVKEQVTISVNLHSEEIKKVTNTWEQNLMVMELWKKLKNVEKVTKLYQINKNT